MIDNSYYIILNRLKAFANGHYLINTFTYHEIANFDITKNPHYPIMHVVPVSMNPTKGAIDYSFNITFADWVRAKEEKQENEVTVISDLHRCALDLCAEITNGNILFGDEVSINGDAVIEPFIDEFANVLSGVTLQITIRVPYDWSACDIPANWVEGTGDIPDFGGRSLTMDIYDEGNFIVAAREMNFVGENVTVTYTGNRAIVTITGVGGGLESVTGNIVDNSDPLNPIVTQEQSNWNESDNTKVEYIRNKPTIPTNTSDLTNDGEDGVNPFITANDIPSLTGYVPYTGATTDVDLGTHNLTADHIALNVNPSGAGFVVGASEWNNTIGSSQTLLKGGNVILKNGVDLVARIVNKVVPNTTLTKAAYQAVRVSGATGGRLSVALAQGDVDLNSADTIGLVCETIATNQEGFIITVGQLLDINTTGSLQGETWVDGDVLYLSPTTPGAITKVKPTGLTGHIVVIGYVEYAHAINGAIYVKVMNGWELDELHNVYINAPSNNDVLAYDNSDSLWKNKSLTKSDVGLSNVDNTSDANKPISTATQTALDLKKNKSEQRIFETTTNQSTTSTTRADVTELTVPMLAGKKYRIELYGMMQSPAVTTGCSVGFYLSAGTATINGIIRGLVQTSASTTALDQFINVLTTTAGAAGSFFTTSGVGAINTPHALGGSFYIESDSNCDFKVQFGSEVAGASTTLLSGSALIVDQLN